MSLLPALTGVSSNPGPLLAVSTWDRLINLSVPQFPFLKNGNRVYSRNCVLCVYCDVLMWKELTPCQPCYLMISHMLMFMVPAGSWFVISDLHLSLLKAQVLLGLDLWSKWYGVGEDMLVLGAGYMDFHLSFGSLLGVAIGYLPSYSVSVCSAVKWGVGMELSWKWYQLHFLTLF